MRLATIFSDLHCHTYKEHDNQGSRLADCLKVIRMIFKFNDKKGITITIFDGDLYDSEGELPTVVETDLIKLFKEMFELYPNQSVFMVTGNHDQATKNLWSSGGVSALTHLEIIFPNITVIDNKSELISSFDGKDITIHGIPYYEYPEDFNQALIARAEQVADNELAILFIHQTPSGLYNESIPNDLNSENPLFKKFQYVYCGHIHKRQDINETFTVIGSPLHRDLGDEGDEKGFLVMDLHEPSTGYQFISTRGKFPEFVRAKRSEFGNYEGQYMVEIPEVDSTQRAVEAKVNEFNTSVKAADLIHNYWKEAGDGDQLLLQTGLSLL